MGFLLSEAASGLVVAEHARSGDDVARLLREHDLNLRLVPAWGGADGVVLWKVYSWNGPDRPADFVCAWQTMDGDPLPLSSGLVEMVKQHDRRTVGAAPDPDRMNAELRERNARDRRAQLDAVADEHRPYVDRGRLAVSVSDAKPGKPGWQRTRRPSKGEAP